MDDQVVGNNCIKRKNARTKCPVQIRTEDENLFPIQKYCVYFSFAFLIFCQWPFFSISGNLQAHSTQQKKDFIIYAQKRSFSFFCMLLLPPKAKAHIEQQQHTKKSAHKKNTTLTLVT